MRTAVQVEANETGGPELLQTRTFSQASLSNLGVLRSTSAVTLKNTLARTVTLNSISLEGILLSLLLLLFMFSN